MNRSVHVDFGVKLLSLRTTFLRFIPAGRSLCRGFAPLCGPVRVLSADGPHCVCPFTAGCSCLFVIVNRASVNICVQRFV